MIQIPKNQQIILNILLKQGTLSSSQVHEKLIAEGSDVSLVTVKRELSEMKKVGFLTSSGAGRGVVYSVSAYGRLCSLVDAKEYTTIDPDKRHGLRSFNFELFSAVPNDIFTDSEMERLRVAGEVYKKNSAAVSPVLEEKELERFVIELSWKLSKIEGNTYTLLDTEKLISRGIEAPGHDPREARMILNHKDAFKFIRENVDSFKEISLSKMEEVHKILVKDLGIDHGIRSKMVGVTGSIYRPLDNSHQIREAIESLCVRVNEIEYPPAKALIALLGIRYTQPFEDGNKRTSRLMANALLLALGHTPLSYRSVDENDYRDAVLAFYELNSIIPFKKTFVDQYVFAAENYAVTR